MPKKDDTVRTGGPVVRDVPAVKRALALLRSLAHATSPMGLVALSKEVDTIPSTCLHILRVLVDRGFVTFDPATKHYALGPAVLGLAGSFSYSSPFVLLVRSTLLELSRMNQLAFAAVERTDVDHIVVVAIGDVNTGVSVRLTLGTRLPLGLSASGRCFLAFGNHSMAELKQRFGALRWDNPPAFETWQTEIQNARRQGYTIDPGNYIHGISIVAVPVFFRQGDIAGCITGVDIKERLTGKHLEKVVHSMKAAAAEASRKLSGTGMLAALAHFS